MTYLLIVRILATYELVGQGKSMAAFFRVSGVTPIEQAYLFVSDGSSLYVLPDLSNK